MRFPGRVRRGHRETPPLGLPPRVRVTPALDGWLLRHFDPENIDATIAAMAAAQAPDDAAAARSEAARRKIADCDNRLVNYRAPSKAGPIRRRRRLDPEVEAERLAADASWPGRPRRPP